VFWERFLEFLSRVRKVVHPEVVLLLSVVLVPFMRYYHFSILDSKVIAK
jgi:hypothetical protein